MAVDRSREFFALADAAFASLSPDTQALTTAGSGTSASPLAAVAAQASAGAFGKGAGAASATARGARVGALAQPNGLPRGGGGGLAQTPPLVFTPSSFTRAAGEVSRDLQRTARKIAELTQLVKKRGVWDDGSTATTIDTLTSSIKDDVARLSGQLDGLQGYVDGKREEAARAGVVPGKPLPPPPASAQGQQATAGPGGAAFASSSSSYSAAATNASAGVDVLSSSQGISHSDAVLSTLKGQLLSFSLSLRDALAARGEGIKHAADRRQAFGRAAERDLGHALSLQPLQPVHPPLGGGGGGGVGGGGGLDSSSVAISISPASGGGANNPPLFRSRHGGGSSSSSSSVGFGTSVPTPGSGSRGGGGHASGGASSAADAFQLVTQAQLEPEMEYLRSRAQDMRSVESAVSEISVLFGRLATLVAEQGEQIDRIDGDLESANTQLANAQGQLQTYYDRVSSNRLLIMKILGVLVAFIVFFSVFLA